jgi:hypothetical protein
MANEDKFKLKKRTLQTKSYFNDNTTDTCKDLKVVNDVYISSQVARWEGKNYMKREENFYVEIASCIKDLWHPQKDEKLSMLCLGARNNWERDTFAKFITKKLKIKSGNLSVFSCDLGANKRYACDFTEDFNNPPKDWHNSWDIVYSNSIDHAIDATETFYKWVDLIKKEKSLLIIGFDINNQKPTKADVCVFTQSSLEKFFDKEKTVKVLKVQSIDLYVHYFLKRKN